jgi:hypothetical protein
MGCGASAKGLQDLLDRPQPGPLMPYLLLVFLLINDGLFTSADTCKAVRHPG